MPCDAAVKQALPRLQGRFPRIVSLVDILTNATTPLPTELVNRLCECLASEPASLRALLRLLTEPSNAQGEPRLRLQSAWVVSVLIVNGNSVLRSTIAKDAGMLKMLVDVFIERDVDAPRVALVAQVLQAIIAQHPREAAKALVANDALVKSCVENVSSQPHADLLPRFVATRVFAAAHAHAVVPAHKRTVAMVARLCVQQLLADKFVHAARFGGTSVCAPAARTMADISSRAMVLPRMTEDPDERHDGYQFSMTHLSIVSAHVYNDAKDALHLVSSPKPLLSVLDIALKLPDRKDVVVPAFELLSSVLGSLAEARASVLPLVRNQTQGICIDKLRNALVERLPAILRLMVATGKTENSPLGGRRLAVADAVVALLSVVSKEELQTILEEYEVIDSLLRLLENYPQSSILHTRVSRTLSKALTADRDIAVAIVNSSDVFSFFVRTAHDTRMQAHHGNVLCALYKVATGAQSEEQRREHPYASSAKAFVEAFTDKVQTLESEDAKGLFREYSTARGKLSDDMLREASLMNTLRASEDYGQQIYINTVVKDASVSKRQTGSKRSEEFLSRHGDYREAAHTYIGAPNANTNWHH